VRTRPAHGGFPGEVVVRAPEPCRLGMGFDARGFLHLGEALIHVEALRALSIDAVAEMTGVPVEDLRWLADGPLMTLGLWRDD
jgi:hypothetical protein